MPEASQRAGLWLVLLAGFGVAGAAPVAAQNQTCPVNAEVTATGTGWLHVVLSVPCQPYAPVDVSYGPLRIGEETSLDGRLTLGLPQLTEVDELGFAVGETRLSVSVLPTDGPRASVIAVRWPDGNFWGVLQAKDAPSDLAAVRLGFPARRDLAPLDVLALPEAASASLIVPVGAETCGKTLAASVISTGFPEGRPLTLSLPSCTFSGSTVTVPLR